MITTQKISALKAPGIIQNLRKKIVELRMENKLLKGKKTKVGKRLDKINKTINRCHLLVAVHTVNFKKFEEKRDTIFNDPSIPHSEQMRLSEALYEEYEVLAEKKKKAIRKLFDFRKIQDLDAIAIEAEKIINS